MQTIEITKDNAIAAYNSADKNGKKLLAALLGEKNLLQKITDRVKTLEDAIEVLGGVSENVKILLDYNGADPDMISSQAHMKLTIIARSLNEGWVPDWSDGSQYKYVPYFEYKAGFGLSYYGYGHWSTRTYVGSRLCFKSSDLAVYAAKQFADIYNDFLTIK